MEMVVKTLELVVDKCVVVIVIVMREAISFKICRLCRWLFLSFLMLLGMFTFREVTGFEISSANGNDRKRVGKGAKQWISRTWCAKSFVCKSFRSFMPFHSQQFNHLTFHLSQFHTLHIFHLDFLKNTLITKTEKRVSISFRHARSFSPTVLLCARLCFLFVVFNVQWMIAAERSVS